MDTLQIQIDHYKETCELQRESIKSRNRFFVYIWIDVFFLFLFVFAKTETLSAVQQWLSNQFGINTSFSSTVFLALIWLLLLYFSIRYIQSNVKIERDYSYIQSLEKVIEKTGCTVFCREGKEYLNNYPFILNYIDFLYKWFFPILLIISVIVKIIIEISDHQSFFGILLDFVISVVIVSLWIAYLVFLRKLTKGS